MIRLSCEGFDLFMPDFDPSDELDMDIFIEAVNLIQMRSAKNAEQEQSK